MKLGSWGLLGLLGVAWVVLLLIGPPAEDERPATGSLSDPRVDVRVTVRSCEVGDGFTWIRGSVRNDGETTVRFVEVRLTWESRAGDVVDTGSTYAVGREHLRPGESSEFSGYSEAGLADECFAELLDYDVVE